MPALMLHERRAAGILLDLKSMMLTVDLDHELRGDAGEVGIIGTDRMLSAKLDAAQPAVAQQFPADPLRLRAVAAKFACTCGLGVLHFPLTRPLPLAGERRMKQQCAGFSAL
ncbi:MAG: hypothetical protein BGN99_11600 [Alphaproteobacteria bacterium 65-37]|nr:MAG: hypothetical protein BGN99_11600 [Alphaproteobacteria bacterium 65-37]